MRKIIWAVLALLFACPAYAQTITPPQAAILGMPNVCSVNASGNLVCATGSFTMTNGAATVSGDFNAGTSSALTFLNRGSLRATADGVFRLTNWAGTSVDRLNFGCDTTSCPAIRRNGSTLQAALADGSAVTTMQAGRFLLGFGGYIDNPSANVLRFANSGGTSTADMTLSGASTGGLSAAIFGGAVGTRVTTVASLTTCVSGLDGVRSFVTDALTPVFGSAVAGSGAVHIPVYCDGSGTPTWKVG